MQNEIQSHIAINTTPAFLSRLTPAGITDNSEVPVPVVPACHSAGAFIRRHRGVETFSTMLRFGPCAVGALALLCEPQLVVVLFDVCEPDIRDWLDEGATRGLLRVGLRDAKGVCVVDVANGDFVDAWRMEAQAGQLCSSNELVRALSTMVDALNDAAGRRLLGVDEVDIDRVLLALVTPSKTHPSFSPYSAH